MELMGVDMEKNWNNPCQQECHHSHELSNYFLLMLFVLSFTLLEQHQKYVVQFCFGGWRSCFFWCFWMEDIVI